MGLGGARWFQDGSRLDFAKVSCFCVFGENGANGADPLNKGRKRWDPLVTEAPQERSTIPSGVTGSLAT